MGLDPRFSSDEAKVKKSIPNYDTAMKLIKKAENKLKSNHLQQFSLKDNVLHGEVKASMKTKVYTVRVR